MFYFQNRFNRAIQVINQYCNQEEAYDTDLINPYSIVPYSNSRNKEKQLVKQMATAIPTYEISLLDEQDFLDVNGWNEEYKL